MNKIARKKVSNAFVISLLSCTILHASGLPAAAESASNSRSLEKIFLGDKRHDGDNRGDNRPAATRPVAANTTTAELEEEVRKLTGKVEELNFMILKMQTQLDELHQVQGTGKAGSVALMPAASPDTASADRGPAQKTGHAAAPLTEGRDRAALPENQGSARFVHQGSGNDSKGNGAAAVDNPAGGIDNPAGGDSTADVPRTNTAQELYQIGYSHVLAGDYRAAEKVFRAFHKRYPNDSMAGDASFWLGEALYGQGRYREAAQVYIEVQRRYKGSDRGPENLLKLGMSMALLDEKDVACATLAEVSKRYKKAEPAVLKRVSDERSRIKCP